MGTVEEKGNAGWAVLGFFIPLVGFILWLVWRESKPADSKMAGIGCLIGVVASVIITIVSFALFSCTASKMVSDARKFI